jgi:branched-chain amino acid transport system substrate-binding protein
MGTDRRVSSSKRAVGILVLLCVGLGLVLAACGGGGSSSSSETTAASEPESSGGSTTASTGGGSCSAGGPIKIGGVSSSSGGVPVPEGSEGAQAYFEQLNENGGVCGQEIEYTVVDDKGEPQASATAARELVLQDGVDAMVSESLVDCSVNKSFYEQEGIRATGVGVNPACYDSSVFGMTNNGPTGSVLGSLIYASSPEGLHKEKVCAELLQLPGYAGQFQEAREVWEKSTGEKMTLYDNTVQPSSDPTPYIIKAKEAGCEAVALIGQQSLVTPWMQAVETQNATEIAWLWPGPAYEQSLPATLGNSSTVYSDPELEPDVTVPAVKKVYTAVENIPGGPANGMNGSTLGGWLAGEVMVAALESVEGEVTRENLGEALEGLKGFQTPLMGGPFEWREIPNHWIKEVKTKGSEWEILTPKWLDLPQLAELE